MSDKKNGRAPKKKGSFREYLFLHELKTADIVLGIFASVLLVLCWSFRMPFSEVFAPDVDITLGYSAKQDADGLYYVVDNGHNRLLCFDGQSRLKYAMENPSTGEDSLYIEDFAIDNGLLYLSATEWNGMLLSKEVVAVFQKGRYVRTITERDYSGMQVNKHRFHGITVQDGVLSYIETEKDSLTAHRVTLADGSERTQQISLKNAFNAVGDGAFYGDAFYVLQKNGNITACEGEKQIQVYSTRWKGEENRFPYRMTISPGGEVAFMDIYAGQVVKVDSNLRKGIPIGEKTVSQTIHYTQDGSGRMYLEDDALRVVSDAGTVTYLTLQKNVWQMAFQIGWFVALVLLVILLSILLFRTAVATVTRKYETSQLVSFGVIATVAMVAAILCGMLIGNFSDIYRGRIMVMMENSARIVANQIPAETISKIQRAEDFDSAAYKSLCDLMEKVFPMDVDLNQQTYCNILRLSEDGERGFTVAYMDQSVGDFFPLDETETEEVRRIYQEGTSALAVWNENVADVSGTYLVVKVPICNDGSVSGVVAVGMDTYVINGMITRLQLQILLSVIVILMLIWLIISEAMAWFSNLSIYRRSLLNGKVDTIPGHLIRLLVFAVFGCYNMTATFLPVWILRNSELFAEASRELMASLPLTVNIFVMGVMSLTTALAVRHLGIGKIMTLSTLCSLSGNLIMFLIPSYFAIFVGLLLDGIGVGLITNATYGLLTYVKEEENQQWGFTIYNAACLSGINFGMLLGSLLAVAIGQRPVFLIVAAVWLVLMLAGNLMVRQLTGLVAASAQEKSAGEISIGRFLFNKPVLSFIVLIQNPYIVFNSFVFYFVPLFCGNMGYDETIVSILIMVYSEVAVLMGDTLTRRITQTLGNKGMYVAYLTNVAAVMVFALTRNMLGLVLALLMMGTAAGYGKTLQQIWFLKQKQVGRYGEDRAMGVYNFTENIGESLGPIVFSRLMAQRPLLGAVSAFCGGMVALGGAHFALNSRELRATIKQKELSLP